MQQYRLSIRSVVLVGIFGVCTLAARLPRAIGTNSASCNGTDIQQSCLWSVQEAPNRSRNVSGSWPTADGLLPVVALSSGADSAVSVSPGFTLSLHRLVLQDAALAPPGAFDAPLFWPLNMFTAIGTKLELVDVRLVLGEQDFQAYLSYFQGLPQPPTVFFTDGKTFLQIPFWSDEHTSLRSVTLLGGSCSSDAGAAAFQPNRSQSAGSSCNVYTANNSTLIPTLKLRGSEATDSIMLVLLSSNATLGVGLQPGAIDINRPVMVAGFNSVPTSIDFGMVVNQINATAKTAQVIWQSLFLENLSPADALASTLAPPYSGAVSANIFAIYCKRSTQVCLSLYNTTSVLATSQEMDYLTFMYSMYNSPLPNMRQVTDFYHTELKVTVLDMGPGPNGFGMSLYNMSTSAWEIHNSVFTDKPVISISKKLPFPEGRPLVPTATKAAPWVQGVDTCSSMQDALLAPSEEDRLHVWMLLSNVSINPPSDPDCWQTRAMQYTTQIYGQVHAERSQQAVPSRQEAAAVPDMFSLSWNFMRSALELPANAQERFLQIQNVSLRQLPQGPNAARAAGMRAEQGADGPSPPDVWTILLWSVNRTWQGNSLYLSDVLLLLPQLEYDFIRQTAQTSDSFVVPLADTVGLAFTGVELQDDLVSIESLQGPGMTGGNILLLADADAADAMPGGHTWPLAVTAAPMTSMFGGNEDGAGNRRTAIAAAVVGSVGGVGLVVLVGFCWWWRNQRKQRQQQAAVYKPDGSYHDPIRGAGHSASDVHGDGIQYHNGLMGVTNLQTKDTKIVVNAESPVAAQHRQQQDVCAGDQAAGIRDGSKSLDGHHPLTAADDTGTIASGLQRWKSAISSTTIQLMERRIHMTGTATGASGSSGSSGQLPPIDGMQPGAAAGRSTNTSSNRQAATNGMVNAAASVASNLQLQELIGQGSFGCVYSGIWHGKRVAVKVMQLPANALLGSQDGEEVARCGQRARRPQANKTSHMAIMETVVSSTMSHPNVVQVYTYMLNPLTVDVAGNKPVGRPRQLQGNVNSSAPQSISGWELRLVMEYCDQGTLREALDHKLLIRNRSKIFLQPSMVLSLAHDVSAAMLHLHSEGVVHGDLKAANVLLTKGGDDPGNVWAATVGYKVTAKVADFGLALTLDPNDTHATMAARGTPTHMSPELFMSGHVSKASDVYAYGILLYEIITSQRAYAGVPIPLLPHEVARQGLRPTWPPGLPQAYQDLRHLAEACWAQEPFNRPTFQEVFTMLNAMQNGRPLPAVLHKQQQAAPQTTMQQAGPQRQEGLHPSAQEQLALVQHQLEERFGPADVPKQPQVPGKDMDWSEVTYGAR